MDQLPDEEEDEIQKKNEKISKFERFIRKIDEKVNPILKFQIEKSYGIWYLVKTEDISEINLENIRYDFIQEQNGYKLIKSYFDPATNVWSEKDQRAWIEEKKGDVYLEVEKKYLPSRYYEDIPELDEGLFFYRQGHLFGMPFYYIDYTLAQVCAFQLFFDTNYQYMVIKFNDGFTRVLSRYPNNEKISLEGNELSEFNQIIGERTDLRDVSYNTDVKSIREIQSERKKEELKRKTEELERQLSENPSLVFQIDTIGAKRALEREMKKQKEKDVQFKTKDGTENVEVIQLDDKDLKNGNEIENNGNSTEINKEN